MSALVGFAIGVLVGSILCTCIHKARITVERAIAETNDADTSLQKPRCCAEQR